MGGSTSSIQRMKTDHKRSQKCHKEAVNFIKVNKAIIDREPFSNSIAIIMIRNCDVFLTVVHPTVFD